MNTTEEHYRSAAEWAGNLLAFMFTITLNGLANGVPLGGQTTGELSDKYPSLFTPAGYVFSIWGLIYLTLSIFIVWQALPQQRRNPTLTAIRTPFLVSCAANGAWILAWHYDQMVLSLLLMITLLCSLVHIYRTLNIDQKRRSKTERWTLQLPFSIYLGWISVAIIANFSAFQIDQGWDNAIFSATIWTLIKIGLAATISTFVLLRFRDAAFMLVTVWACVGIAAKHTETPIIGPAALGVALLGSLLVVATYFLNASAEQKSSAT